MCRAEQTRVPEQNGLRREEDGRDSGTRQRTKHGSCAGIIPGLVARASCLCCPGPRSVSTRRHARGSLHRACGSPTAGGRRRAWRHISVLVIVDLRLLPKSKTTDPAADGERETRLHVGKSGSAEEGFGRSALLAVETPVEAAEGFVPSCQRFRETAGQ